MDSEANTSIDEVIDIEKIIAMIPHRYPFLMIDRVTNIIPNQSAIGIKNVTANEQYFQGHFPERPVMPGVLIVESMAQTAAVVVVHSAAGESDDKLVYFMSIDSARFRKPVTPGDRLYIHVNALQSRGRVWKFRGEAYVDDALVAEANFTAMIVDK